MSQILQTPWIFPLLSHSRLVPEYHSRRLPMTLPDTGVEWTERQKSDEVAQLAMISKVVSKAPTNDYPTCSLRRHITCMHTSLNSCPLITNVEQYFQNSILLILGGALA